jgi:hypothetical protein
MRMHVGVTVLCGVLLVSLHAQCELEQCYVAGSSAAAALCVGTSVWTAVKICVQSTYAHAWQQHAAVHALVLCAQDMCICVELYS